MRLKDYARNHKKRKDYVQQTGLLMAEVDVKPKHDACMGTQKGIIYQKLTFTNTREGFNSNILEQSRME